MSSDNRSSKQSVCYCGAYGGGMHTKSARCGDNALGSAGLHHLITVYGDMPGLPYSAQIVLLLKELQERRAVETRADGDVTGDTGHAEADRIISRLASSDPDFDDCTDAAVLIRRLVADAKGPDGYATWKDAAVAERIRRVAAESGVKSGDDPYSDLPVEQNT